MAGRLTQRLVEAAKAPTTGQMDRFSSETAMLEVSRSGSQGMAAKHGSGTAVLYSPPDAANHATRDLSLNEARAEALKIRHDIAVGLDPSEQRREQREELTVGRLAALYLENYARQHKRSWAQDERRIRLHFRPLASLNFQRSAERAQRAGISVSATKAENSRLTVAMSCCLLCSVGRSGLASGKAAIPPRVYTTTTKPNASVFLNADELSRLWAVLDTESSPYWRAYFKLALLLGMRKTELLRARWENVDLDQATWTLPNTKNNRPHTVPIPKPAIEILQSLPSKHTSPWLFPSEKRRAEPLNRADDAWERIRKQAGLTDMRIHDLRRTLGSWLAAQGCSLPLIGRTLNHSNVATTQIYARWNLDPVREALEKNAALMLRLAPRAVEETSRS